MEAWDRHFRQARVERGQLGGDAATDVDHRFQAVAADDLRGVSVNGVLVEAGAVDAAGVPVFALAVGILGRSEEHTSELQSLMRISYAVFCLKKNKKQNDNVCFDYNYMHNNYTLT